MAASRYPARDALLAMSDDKLLALCEVNTYRASGPGGQKRNKIESAVRIRHTQTGVDAVAVESRSQHENRRRALKRLRLAIALAVRSDVNLDNLRLSPELRKLLSPPVWPRVPVRRPEYLLLVGIVLDVLSACGGRIGDAARHLAVSTASLSTFITRDRKLHEAANRLRLAGGLKALK